MIAPRVDTPILIMMRRRKTFTVLGLMLILIANSYSHLVTTKDI